MGENQSPALIVVALLLLAAATPLAYGQLLSGINVNGTICCTPTGTCPGSGGTPLSGVPVVLNCTTTLLSGTIATVTVGTGITGANGSFNISVPVLGNALPVVNGIVPCLAAVQLPLSPIVCPLLSNTAGIIAGVPQLVRATLFPLLGFLGTLTVEVMIVT